MASLEKALAYLDAAEAGIIELEKLLRVAFGRLKRRARSWWVAAAEEQVADLRVR